MEVDMTAWSYGWVEVPQRFAPEQGASWEGILNLEPFFNEDDVSPEPWGDLLFDAFTWGFPDDVSQRVLADYERLRALMDDPEFVTTPRWAPLPRLRAVWPQLRAIPLRSKYLTPSRRLWADLMQILDIFARRNGEERVRLIHWAVVPM
jgi:hypothetical protein